VCLLHTGRMDQAGAAAELSGERPPAAASPGAARREPAKVAILMRRRHSYVGTVWEGEAPAEPVCQARQEPRSPRKDDYRHSRMTASNRPGTITYQNRALSEPRPSGSGLVYRSLTVAALIRRGSES